MRTIAVTLVALFLLAPETGARVHVAGLEELGDIVTVVEDGRTVCRMATAEETAAMKRPPLEELRVIKSERSKIAPTPGLTLQLRGTSQLDRFPEAKAAFIRAAEAWEAIIRDEITVVVDVDFGPTRFGTPFPAGARRFTNVQFGRFAYRYPTVREALVERASSPEEAAIFDLLPDGPSVPSTVGPVELVYSSTAPLRSLGILPAVADPVAEAADLGPPPSIAFNSAFDYDFDPLDGLDPDTMDFNAVALHELGHVLGFFSWVGIQEIQPDYPRVVTVWDLFRFRPGVTRETFGTAERVLASGGEHVYFDGTNTIPLSTGRLDGMGGSIFTANHWQDRATAGIYLGIMDPQPGEHDPQLVTREGLRPSDSHALIGAYLDLDPVTVEEVTGRLVPGERLFAFEATVGVANRSMTEYHGALGSSLVPDILAEMDAPLGTAGPARSRVSFAIPFADAVRAATHADLTFRDDLGNESRPVRVDLTAGDPGAPTISKVKYKGSKLKVTGTGLSDRVRLEVNGNYVTAASVAVKGGGKKLVATATPDALGLVEGINRIRVVLDDAASNTTILDF